MYKSQNEKVPQLAKPIMLLTIPNIIHTTQLIMKTLKNGITQIVDLVHSVNPMAAQ